jgi:predicted permease
MWLQHIGADIRHGLRLFAKSPGFAAIAVLSIAFGTGANVAMFSAVDTLLLRPLPVDRANELITVGARDPGGLIDFSFTSFPDFVDIRARTTTLTGLVAFHAFRTGIARSASAPRQVRVVTTVSGNFFDDLGIPLSLGRGFRPDEDRVPGRDPVVVIDHGLWQGTFGGAPDVIGRPLFIGGTAFTVVGVTVPSFTGVIGAATPEAAYVPLAMWTHLVGVQGIDPLTDRDLLLLTVMARLRGGVRLEQARAELDVIASRLAEAYPDTNTGRALVAMTRLESKFAEAPVVAPLLVVLSILSLAVLGVACANVAGLLASRAPLRARELGLRMALGAGRGRLITQLFTENVAIAVAGGIGGVAVGYAGSRLIGGLQMPTELLAIPPIRVNERALVFSLAVAMGSAVLFGLGPAFTSTRIELANALRVADPAGRRRWRLSGRNTLIALQVSLSLAVLTVATISLQTFNEAFGKGPGFRTTQLAKIDVDASQAGYTGATAAAFFARVVNDAAAVPGVVRASVVAAMPLWGFEMADVDHDTGPLADGEFSTNPFANVVDEHYFATMEIPLLRGRGFRAEDSADGPRVAVVNETMARRYWPGEEAVGQRLTLLGPTGGQVEIVGVVRNSVYIYPAELPQKMLYLPLRQAPRGTMVLLAQTAGPSAGPLPALRDVVRRVDAGVPTYDAQTIEHFYDTIAVSIYSVVLTLITGIGIIGVTITVIGLYGLVSYSVNRRTKEIGIRVAVGATYARIMRLLLRQGLTPAWVGLATGSMLSAAAVIALQTFAPFSQTYEGWTLAALVPLLFAVTLLAAFVPARRAATVNPVVALRDD